MTKFTYSSYKGDGSYICILCHAADTDNAAAVANALAEKGFRTAYEIFGGSNGSDPEAVANDIERAAGTLVFLSESACSLMVFRNGINFIVETPSPDLFVRLNGYVLKDGLDIQLANKRVVGYKDAESTVEKLIADGTVTQDMKAAQGEITLTAATRRRNGMKAVTAAALFLLVLGLAGGAYGAVQYRQKMLEKNQAETDEYRQSDEYILPRLNNSVDLAKYVKFSKYDRDSLKYLDGLTIGTLDLSKCGFTDISPVSGIDVSVVNVAQNPELASLEPLLECPHLQKVIVSRDMTELTGIFDGKDIIIELQ